MKYAKPSQDIQKIIDVCQGLTVALPYEHGKSLKLPNIQSGNVLFLTSGAVNVYRAQDDLLISELKSPYIFGIIHSEIESHYCYIKSSTHATFTTINYDEFTRRLNENNLWPTLFKIVSHMVTYFIRRDLRLVNQNRYNVVKSFLHELNELPIEKKSKTTVTNYIVRRSGLSRSGVMGILSELKKGQYIALSDKGHLLSLNDSIPDNF
ncbi:helix-turn-helix domain-containing protein [Scandinavium goeteborgense]|uniref:helix-turn-helix domain-containing protein n=1 Tax=Scandinavium goeteborgense TaxID=1851514 RepID=UPI000F67F360|nr:helix-turn-helix domain-containing protein [Scandinavium goeteborgense]QKN79840.1 helix-turn-helix domain-containing protein [Scandinavium goeteborgense]